MNWPKHCEADRCPVSASGRGGSEWPWVPPHPATATQTNSLVLAFLAASLDARQLQPGLLPTPGTHSFILLRRAKALLLDSSHVEHVSVRQRLLNALKFLLEGKAEPG